MTERVDTCAVSGSRRSVSKGTGMPGASAPNVLRGI